MMKKMKSRNKNRKGMNETVPPIKDRTTLGLIRKALKNNFRYGKRNLMIFDFSYFTLLRMVDVLRIRYSDVYDKNGNIKKYFTIQEQKTGKDRPVWLNVGKLTDELEQYRKWLKQEHMDNSEWLFPVKYPEVHIHNVKSNHRDRPLSRHRYYLILKKVQHIIKLPYSLGNHTARKTQAWNFYVKSNYNIGSLMKLLNHSSESATLHYIGESQRNLLTELQNVNK